MGWIMFGIVVYFALLLVWHCANKRNEARREQALYEAEALRRQAAAEERQALALERAKRQQEMKQQREQERQEREAAAEARRVEREKQRREARAAERAAAQAEKIAAARELAELRERELAAARELAKLRDNGPAQRRGAISDSAAPDPEKPAPAPAVSLDSFAAAYAKPEPVRDAPKPFKGQTVAFTGKLSSMSRQAAIEKVQQAGGKAYKTMPAGTTLLVVGNNPGMCKMDKADEWIGQVRKITEAQFLAMFAA